MDEETNVNIAMSSSSDVEQISDTDYADIHLRNCATEGFCPLASVSGHDCRKDIDVVGLIVSIQPVRPTKYRHSLLCLSLTDPTLEFDPAKCSVSRTSLQVAIFSDVADKLPSLALHDVIMLFNAEVCRKANNELEVRVSTERLRYATFSKRRFDSSSKVEVASFYPNVTLLNRGKNDIVKSLFQWSHNEKHIFSKIFNVEHSDENVANTTCSGYLNRAPNVQSSQQWDNHRSCTSSNCNLSLSEYNCPGRSHQNLTKLTIRNGKEQQACVTISQLNKTRELYSPSESIEVLASVIGACFSPVIDEDELPSVLYLYLSDPGTYVNKEESVLIVSIRGDHIWHFFDSTVNYSAYNHWHGSKSKQDRISASLTLVEDAFAVLRRVSLAPEHILKLLIMRTADEIVLGTPTLFNSADYLLNYPIRSLRKSARCGWTIL